MISRSCVCAMPRRVGLMGAALAFGLVTALGAGCARQEAAAGAAGTAAGTSSPATVAASGGAASAASSSSGAAAPQPVTKAYASVNGLQMYYEIHGRADGRPLVLLHGGGSTIQTTFGKVLPAFAAARRVIAPEQQGHGHTADIDRPLTFAQMADDTAALLRSIGVAQADVLGFSNGGNVAMQLAIRHPALVRKAIVASSFYKNGGIYANIRESFKRPVSPKDMPPALRSAYETASPHPEKLPVLVTKLMAMLNTFEDWQASDLQGIKAPVLFMSGDADVARPEHTVEMFRLVPHAQLAIFPGTPHGAYLGEASGPPPCRGCPESAVAMIEAFLEAPMPAAEPAP